ncbi:Glutamate synthase [NADPH] large chain [Minicystis rosea]|nr:Glutamate synthase [NADPH] large chain [Minicystis rosea]
MAGLDQGLVATFPRAANAAAQLLGDLNRLNDIGQLSDGSMPLRTWLDNALALCGPVSQAQVFREVLTLLSASRASGMAPPSPSMAPAPAAAGGSTFNINIQGGTIGSLAVGDGATSNGRVEVRRASGEEPATSSIASGSLSPPASSRST